MKSLLLMPALLLCCCDSGTAPGPSPKTISPGYYRLELADDCADYAVEFRFSDSAKYKLTHLGYVMRKPLCGDTSALYAVDSNLISLHQRSGGYRLTADSLVEEHVMGWTTNATREKVQNLKNDKDMQDIRANLAWFDAIAHDSPYGNGERIRAIKPDSFQIFMMFGWGEDGLEAWEWRTFAKAEKSIFP
jgi:hypothetical protein